MNWVRFKVDDVCLYVVFNDEGVVEIGGSKESRDDRRVVTIEAKGVMAPAMPLDGVVPWVYQLPLGKELMNSTITLGERRAV